MDDGNAFRNRVGNDSYADNQANTQANESAELRLEARFDASFVAAVAVAVPEGGFFREAVYPLKKIAIA
ncbi:MAG TPA: hypothetical protein VFU82_07430 [Gammaproteobacteria bacterium]|nr:hypothetical protein [Gammaproteobacteria bacterium]